MNLALPLRTRQGLALGILTLVIVLAWNVLVWPIIDFSVSRQSDVAVLTNQLRELRAIQQRAPALGKREQAAVASLQSLGVFWSGPSLASIAASMQDLIRSAAQKSGGVVVSSSALPEVVAHGPGMLGVRARVDGSLDTLQHVLAAIDIAHPKLFFSNLIVSAVAPGTKEQPQKLSFELSVSGYIASVQHAR